jgi:aspartate kinase
MIVMKFGGTSVQDKAAVRRVIDIVGRERRPRLVVVSALSRVTDGLLEIASRAERREADAATQAVRALHARHEELATIVGSAERRATLLASLDATFAELLAMVGALAVRRRGLAPIKGHDRRHRRGRQQPHPGRGARGCRSALALARPARAARHGWHHGAALPDREATDARLRARALPHLEAGLVGVTGGFVGASAEGLTTTLGRGGSDYSAALFGAGLAGAGDPDLDRRRRHAHRPTRAVVEAPRVVSRLSFDEASELAYFGAKVLHPSTILPAVGSGIPVRILNSHRPEADGTWIARETAKDAAGPAAIACKRGLTRIDIASTRMLMAYGFLRRVFEVFERYRTPVDVVTTSEVSVSVTIDDRRSLDAIVSELSAFADVTCEDAMAIVCAVGEALRSDARLATQVLGALEGLPLAMVSQGGSRKNVTVVLRDADVTEAMRRLHRRFFETGPTTAERTALATA